MEIFGSPYKLETEFIWKPTIKLEDILKIYSNCKKKADCSASYNY